MGNTMSTIRHTDPTVPMLVFPAQNGSFPRECELGQDLFYRYLHLLDLPLDQSTKPLLLLGRLAKKYGIPTKFRSTTSHHPFWSDRDRRAMHSLCNWSEYVPFARDPLTKDPRREQEGSVTSPPVKDSHRSKTRISGYFTLGNTSLDSTSRLRVWTPPNEGAQPPYVVTEVQDQIDYQVGLGRPFRPVSGVKVTNAVPSLTGVGLRVNLGYEPLPGKFPAAYKWYEGMPEPQIFDQRPWQRFGLPVDEQTVSPSATEIQARRDEALASLYAGTPGHRPNFLRALLELKDLRSSVRGLADFFSWGNQVLRRWANRPLWQVRADGSIWETVMTGRETIRQMAGLYLNGLFGIIPTVQDASLFTKKLREGLKVFAEDRGTMPPFGGVVTSHYQVLPRETLSFGKPKLLREFTKNTQIAWYNSDWAKVRQSSNVLLSAGDLGQQARQYKVVRATVISGTVFARFKQEDELSTYLKQNFGRVGYTWSYPGITTAWELLPWSWLVDWFTDARVKIRAAERLARSYWMRVAFQEPWYFEKIEYRRFYPNFRFHLGSVTGPTRCRFYGGGSPMRATVVSRWLAYAFYGSGYSERSTYSRGPLETRPDVPVQRTRCKVNVFRISIGMALIAQAATGSRRFRRWLSDRSRRIREPHLAELDRKRGKRYGWSVRKEARELEARQKAARRRALDDFYWESYEDTL